MVAQTQPSLETEPTPEFNERCMAFITGWRHGDMPTADAIQKLKDLAREAATAGHSANQGRAEHLSGYIQHYLGNYSASNTHYDTARRLFQRVGNRRRMATMDLNMGENFRYKGEFKRARSLYRSAYEAAVSLGDVLNQTIAIANEGLMLVNMQDYANARTALAEGLRLSEAWGDNEQLPALRTEIYYGLAEVDLATGDSASAWHNAHLALQYASAAKNNLHSVGLAYRILGDALTALGQAQPGAAFDNPDDYYRAAQETFKEIDAEAEIARTVFHHAKSLAQRGRRRTAAQLLRNAMVIFTKLGMTNDVAHAAEAQLSVI